MLGPRINGRKINTPKIGRGTGELDAYLVSYRRNGPDIYNATVLLFQGGFVRDTHIVAALDVAFQKDHAAERVDVQHGGDLFGRRAVCRMPGDDYGHLQLQAVTSPGAYSRLVHCVR